MISVSSAKAGISKFANKATPPHFDFIAAALALLLLSVFQNPAYYTLDLPEYQ
jgi:hypothetical protein